MARSCSSDARTAAGSSIAMLSVSSRISRRGSRPESRSVALISSTSVGRLNCTLDRFTDIQTSAAALRVLPRLQLPARLGQHPLPQRHDEAGALGQRNEFQRRDQSQHRMLPADQRLETHDLVRGQRDDRLIQRGRTPRARVAPAKSASSRSSDWAIFSTAVSNTSQRLPPSRRARCTAASASWSTSSACVVAGGAERRRRRTRRAAPRGRPP